MAAAMRMRSFEQARQALMSVDGGASPAPPRRGPNEGAKDPPAPPSTVLPAPASVPQTSAALRPSGKRSSARPRPIEPVVEVLGLEDVDVELDSAD
jgi:hypothetical protein